VRERHITIGVSASTIYRKLKAWGVDPVTIDPNARGEA
jgi:hypothetical protein